MADAALQPVVDERAGSRARAMVARPPSRVPLLLRLLGSLRAPRGRARGPRAQRRNGPQMVGEDVPRRRPVGRDPRLPRDRPTRHLLPDRQRRHDPPIHRQPPVRGRSPCSRCSSGPPRPPPSQLPDARRLAAGPRPLQPRLHTVRLRLRQGVPAPDAADAPPPLHRALRRLLPDGRPVELHGRVGPVHRSTADAPRSWAACCSSSGGPRLSARWCPSPSCSTSRC